MGSLGGGRNKTRQSSESQGTSFNEALQRSNSTSQGTSSSSGMSSNQGTSSSQGTNSTRGGSSSSGSSVSSGSGSSISKQRAGLTAQEVLANWDENKSGTDQWSKSSALGDVQGVLSQQATDALQSVMPSIARTQSNSGSYDSTTKDLMQNDANARITSQLSKTALDAITQYGTLGNQTNANNNQLLSGLASVAGSTGASDASSASLQAANSAQVASSFEIGDSQQSSISQQSALSKQEALSQQTALSDSFGKTIGGSQQTSSGSGSGSGWNMSGALGKADGGKVEESAAGEALKKLAESGDGYAMLKKMLTSETGAGGGSSELRSGSEDVKKGGKIAGKQSASGKDNQLIAVAGGEGIIPKDVMEIEGVPQFLEHLIAQYHTPVKK